MQLEDLMCQEEVASMITPTTTAAAAAAATTELTIGVVDLKESLMMMLQNELQSGSERNWKYLSEVQRHGMEVSWRKKICHWMFEVSGVLC